jgi:hypothetical protein
MEMLPIPGAEIYYEAQFIVRDESDRIFDILTKKCAWERRMGPFGHPVPRDEAYYGDADAHLPIRAAPTFRCHGSPSCFC